MEESLKPGNYVIIQRQNYTKLHKLKEHGTITLGKDVVELNNVLGHGYFETFRMSLKPNNKRVYVLEKIENVAPTSQLNIEESGKDNRNITDDNCAQTLSKEEIEEFRDGALGSADIVEKLVTNSKSFKMKTEYSQEKYIRKKEKKYFEYIHFCKPSIRLLAQMFYRQDPSKVLGMRIDDLSQILTYANVQSEGDYLLYDSGTSGLIPAAIMNAIGANTTGRLVHTHPGNECQKSAFLAMSFPKEQTERCINVNIYSVLRWFYQQKKIDISNTEINHNKDTPQESSSMEITLTERVDDSSKSESVVDKIDKTLEQSNLNSDIKKIDVVEPEVDSFRGIKRAYDDQETSSTDQSAKRPCWHYDNEKACEILRNKVDSVIIVAKEHPENIVKELVQFLKPSRSLIVFSIVSEPLEELYFSLKKRGDLINVKLTNNFLRNYQILPERTHPEINMNFGGYLLSAFKLKS